MRNKLLKDVKDKIDTFKKEIHKVVIGYDDTIESLLLSLIAGGHVLLEGVPGLAKTTLAKTFADAASLQFSRIQFTPDILPTDVTGTNIFDQKTNNFFLKKGPVFTQILLADEINRAPPRTQSALLQCMQEKQVTIDENTYHLSDPFFVIATQNPIEMGGVYPLPEAQVDRFMFKLVMNYLDSKKEKVMIKNYISQKETDINVVLNIDFIQKMRGLANEVKMSSKIFNYIYNIISTSRSDEKILLGGSPRAACQLAIASKVFAIMKGRNYVIPDDVKTLTPLILNHRLIIKPEVELEGLKIEQLIQDILKKVAVPRLA